MFVTDDRRSRLLKLGFGTTMLEGSKLAKAVNTSSNDPPSSSVKFKNNEPNVILTAEEVKLSLCTACRLMMIDIRLFTLSCINICWSMMPILCH